jgi:hypothetical protein
MCGWKMDGWIYGQMDVDEWMIRWIKRWMDEWMDWSILD